MNIVYAGVSENAGDDLALLRSAAAPVIDQDTRETVWLPGASLDIRGIEAALDWLAALWKEQKPDAVLFPASGLGHELAVRMSVRLKLFCFPEAQDLRRAGSGLWGRKKVCGSNLDWEREIPLPAALTIPRRRVRFSGRLSKLEKIESGPLPLSALPRWLLSYETLEPFAANPLESARFIFAGGRGLGSAALTERLRRLAFRYGAALGLSRPAALNGWGKTGDIIGQSGVRTQAECCLAVGISGAAAFMTGIESSAYVIAVNTDAHAPVFQYADMGIIAGAEAFISAMEAAAESKPEMYNR